MRVFMDFEASGLTADSYPIEIAWVFEDDSGGESHLIRPAEGWTSWTASGEETHGISRARLDADGRAAKDVARRVVEALSGHDLYASAPDWDGKWLSDLLEAGGFARERLTLRDTEVAQAEVIAETLGVDLATAPRDPGEELPTAVETIMVLAQMEERRPHHHRALDDAEEERLRWLKVREMAEERKLRRY
ncbi:MAG: transcriptional regulator [Sphingomonadales bacterium]